MAMVNFKKGLRANMPATYAEGTFYVCSDERAMYLDISNEQRIRLGDFQEFATIDALTANTNPSTTALYYVADINCLAKWNGSEYLQVNRDTGCTSVEVVGEGNAVTAAVYSADGRKLTLTKGATYMTAADVDSKISAADTELRAYVDEKTKGIATDAALGELQDRVATAEGEIDVLQAAIGENGSVTNAIAAAQSKADEAAEAAAAAQSTADSKTTMAEVEAKDYATKAEAQAMADGKDEAIAAAKAAADAAQGDVDALAGKVGEVPADKTVVQMIADAQATATYDDTEVKADIAENSGKIAAIEADYLKKADKDELAASVQAEADRAAAAEQVNAEAIAAVKEDVDAFLNAAEVGEAAVDTLKEIQSYIESDGAAADEMTKNIGDNKAAIEAEVKRAGEAETALSGRLDALEAIDHDAYVAADTALKNELNAEIAKKADATALAEAKSELEGEISAVDAKFANYTNTEGMNAAIAAVDGKFASYSTTEQMNAAIKVEEDRAKGIEAGLEGRLAAVEGDYLKGADKTELEGKVTAENERAVAAEATLAGRLDTLEAIDHEAYKAYADQAEADAVSTAQANLTAALSWGEF